MNANQEHSLSAQAPFGVAICVGSGDSERVRFEDFANSVFHYEPGVCLFAVVDDAIPPRPLL
jgi:hypothetical protein